MHVLKYSSLQEYLDDVKRREQHKKRLADKLFHTVRSGSSNEIQAVIKACSDADVDLKPLNMITCLNTLIPSITALQTSLQFLS